MLFMIIRCVSKMFLIFYQQVNFRQHTNALRLFFVLVLNIGLGQIEQSFELFVNIYIPVVRAVKNLIAADFNCPPLIH